MRILLSVIGLTSAAHATLEVNKRINTDFLEQFENFSEKFNKNYLNENLKQIAFTNFVENVQRYNLHNQKYEEGTFTYRLGINKFSDLSDKEFKQQYLMPTENKKMNPLTTEGEEQKLPYPEEEMQFPCPTSFVPSEKTSNGIPEFFANDLDWRDPAKNPDSIKAVGNVKDQGSCGSCYAFSATGAYESALCKNGLANCDVTPGEGINIAEQQILDCGSYRPRDGENRMWKEFEGCNGGWQSNVYQYIFMAKGITTGGENGYEYVSGQKPAVYPDSPMNVGQCPYSNDWASRDEWITKNRVSWVGKEICGTTSKNSNTDPEYIKKAIFEKGPIAINMHVGGTFRDYVDGVYVPAEEDCPNLLSEGINHCMMFVGYGQELINDEMVDYWIVKNSWGNEWADDGFIKVKMGINACGCEGNTAYVDVDADSTVDNEIPRGPVDDNIEDFYDWYWKEDELSELEKYVYEEDSNYKWDYVKKMNWDETNIPNFEADNFEAHFLNLTSQRWLDDETVTHSIWTHELYVMLPKKFNPEYNNSAMVYIDGGNQGCIDNPNCGGTSTYYEMKLAIEIADKMGCAVIVIRQIPNESVRFYDDHFTDWSNPKEEWPLPPPSKDPNDHETKGKNRSEDGIIAYTWWYYLDKCQGEKYGDSTECARWLLRFPMTKAVIRAMDAATEFIEQKYGETNKIEKWVAAGASKRGWTTWTVGAVDKRIVGIAPLVMDILQLNRQMHSHYQDLQGWTFAFQDYWWENMTTFVDTYEMGGLCKHVDPWSYRYKYRNRNINIYVVNSVGDEFFLIDDNQNYMDDLKAIGMRDDQIFQRYLRNAEHSMAVHEISNQNIGRSIMEFIAYTVHPEYFKLPKIHWKNNVENFSDSKGTGQKAILRLETDVEPEAVTLIYGRTQSRQRRDFRLVYVGCLERNETTGQRYDHEDCDCPQITEYAENVVGKDTKGICVQPLFWTKHNNLISNLNPYNSGTKLSKVRNGKQLKYQYAWEAEVLVYDSDDYYRSAYIEFKFPSILHDPYLNPEEDAKVTSHIINSSKDDAVITLESIFQNFNNNNNFYDQEDEFPEPGSGDFELPDRRGSGFLANGQAVIVPDTRPGQDCSKDSCYGQLV